MNFNRAVRLVFLLSACLATASASSGDVRPHEEDDIREAVFRYQFEHNASGQQKRAGVYCLSIGDDTNPSDEFMKRFAGHNPPVRKLSECTVGLYDGVVDKGTHKVGLKFRVSSIKWISASEVEARGGYFEGGLSASGNTYSVVKVHGKWKVAKDRMNWISTNREHDCKACRA